MTLRGFFVVAVLVVAIAVFGGTRGHAGEELTGIPALACQAKLCLAAVGSAPAECAPALAYYYAIEGKTGGITRALRQAFLNKCPTIGQVAAPADGDAVAVVSTVIDADGYEVSLGVVPTDENGVLIAACSACEKETGDAVRE